MFSVVGFTEEFGDTLAVVHSKWLTPLKKEVFWPPYKDTKVFNKAVLRGEEVSDKWKLYSISKCYYTADNFELAQKKLKLAELTSDLQTDSEDSESITLKSKRKVTRPIRFDSDEEYSENNIPRPPSLNNLRPNIEAPNDHRYEAGSASAGTSSNYSSKAINIGKVRELTHDSIRPAKELIINGSEAISKSALEILLTNLLEIKQQNKKILNLLDQKESLAKSVIPDDLPVTFPLKNLDDLVSFEGYLTSKSEGAHAIVKHWSGFGGKDVSSKTSRILKEVLSDGLAKDYNFYGRHTKKAFSELKLNSEIIRAVKLTCNGCSSREIEDVIKTWLKHAPERLKKKKQNNNND